MRSFIAGGLRGTGSIRAAGRAGQPERVSRRPLLRAPMLVLRVPPYTEGMFTGLIQAVGEVRTAEPTDRGMCLTVRSGSFGPPPARGDSIAVNGVCLTVAGFAGASSEDLNHPWREGIRFDVVTETLRRSSLGSARVGSRVNLEHAARADTLLGGHIVQGHVDVVGSVVSVRDDPADWRVRVGVPPEAMAAIAPKGSVAVEGVSLTVAESLENAFVVALIPETLEKTTLAALSVGDSVNIETDILARQVLHALRVAEVIPSG